MDEHKTNWLQFVWGLIAVEQRSLHKFTHEYWLVIWITTHSGERIFHFSIEYSFSMPDFFILLFFLLFFVDGGNLPRYTTMGMNIVLSGWVTSPNESKNLIMPTLFRQFWYPSTCRFASSFLFVNFLRHSDNSLGKLVNLYAVPFHSNSRYFWSVAATGSE